MLPLIAMLSGCEQHKKQMQIRKYTPEQIKYQKENIAAICKRDEKRFGIKGIRFSQMLWGSYFMKGKLIQIGRLQYEINVHNFEQLNSIQKENEIFVYIHIPEGSPLSPDQVDVSLEEAKKRIYEFYPEIRKKKLRFFTETWLLGDVLDKILPINSNILLFKKRFQILSQRKNLEDFFNFVFGKIGEVRIEELPEKTSLQKELKKLLLEGKDLTCGLGILKERNYDLSIL